MAYSLISLCLFVYLFVRLYDCVDALRDSEHFSVMP